MEYCEAQHTYIDTGEGLASLERHSASLARAAHLRLFLPEHILEAMQIAGCYRMKDLCHDAMTPECRRCANSLHLLLRAYYGAAGRPLDRRIGERPPKNRSAE